MTTLLENLEELYFDELRDILDAGRQKVEAFERMASAASSSEVRMQLVAERDRTQADVSQLRQAFVRATLRGPHHCRGIEGLLRGGLDLVGMMVPPKVRDTGLLIAATKAQHYEFVGLGLAGTMAARMGRSEEARLLHGIAEHRRQAEADFTKTLCAVSSPLSMNQC